MTQAYCRTCRQRREMVNEVEEIIDTTRGKRKVIKGQCSYCGQNTAFLSALPKEIDKETDLKKEIEERTFEELIGIRQSEPEIKDKEIDRLNEEIEKLSQKKIEREKIKKFSYEANHHPLLKRQNFEMVDKNEKEVVNKNYYNLLKILLIIFAIFVGGFIFLSYNDKFVGKFICEEQICNASLECGVVNLSCENICPNLSLNITQECPPFPDTINILIKNESI